MERISIGSTVLKLDPLLSAKAIDIDFTRRTPYY